MRNKTARAVPPESLLAHRWRTQAGRARTNPVVVESDTGEEEEDVKMMLAGLIVPSHRSDALPDSVRFLIPVQ